MCDSGHADQREFLQPCGARNNKPGGNPDDVRRGAQDRSSGKGAIGLKQRWGRVELNVAMIRRVSAQSAATRENAPVRKKQGE